MNIVYAQNSSTVQKAVNTKAISALDSSSQNESLQRKADLVNNATQRAETPRPNNTGMPDNLKSGIESLSGFSMDDVRVHYNSSKPATVQALAYTQGTDIHVAPGQEKHLPHEAWHVAQQMAGRVSPTMNINGMPVNDNAGLEHEADVMGAKAVQCKGKDAYRTLVNKNISQETVQCAFESRIKEFAEIPIGTCVEGDRPIIAFEVMVGVGDRIEEIKNLYNKVIGEYNGPAHVYVGVNQMFYTHPGYYQKDESSHKKGEPKSQPSPNDAVKLTNQQNMPTGLRNAVTSIQGIRINPNHKIHVIPFIYIPTYNPKEGEKGGYTFPFMEARHLLMTKAHECGASIFRWIDSDVENDTSIEAINTNGDAEFNPTHVKSDKPVVYSGFYNWRGDNEDVDQINKHEAFFRHFFWYSHGFVSKENEYDGVLGYIPEPIAYMNKAAHQTAIRNLYTKFTSLAYKGSESCQQNEAAAAFNGLTMIYKPAFSVSKPVKDGYNVSAPNQELAELKKVRQSAFERWTWDEKEQDTSMKEKVLALSKRLNSLLSQYQGKIKKEKESELLSAIFDDIINKNGDKTINEIEIFFHWKKEKEKELYKIKWIDDSKYVITTIGGHLLTYTVQSCPHLIAKEPPSKFLV